MTLSGIRLLSKDAKSKKAASCTMTTRKMNSLLGAAEGQLLAGKNLDKKPPRPVPILERIFNDRDLFTKPTDSLKSRLPYVTPNMPFVTNAAELTGISSIMINQMYKSRQTSKALADSSSDGLRILYFPPWHFLSWGRRSRPGLVTILHNRLKFNGEKVNPDRAQVTSSFLFDYAFHRHRAKRFFKKAFMTAWQECALRKDGLYVIEAVRLPSESSAVTQFLSRFLNKVLKHSSFEWVHCENEKFNLKKINALYRKQHFNLLVSNSKEEWDKSIIDNRRLSNGSKTEARFDLFPADVNETEGLK